MNDTATLKTTIKDLAIFQYLDFFEYVGEFGNANILYDKVSTNLI